ncbi:MAG: TlpA family protein disulfide reductase [Hyphomicrobiales bacterium]|nr:TlpA family protein disulfide reductase [Hyphomicrobiales bacterium]
MTNSLYALHHSRFRTWLASAILCCFIAFPAQSAPLLPIDIPLKTEEGEVTLRGYEGKVLLLNFWATWCQSCIEEMPSLMALEEKYKDQGLVLLAVSEDFRGFDVIPGFLKRNGLEALNPVWDPKSKLYNALRLKALPTTLIIDRQGREAGRMVGGLNWMQPDIRKDMEALLNEPSEITSETPVAPPQDIPPPP